jgi:O-antigen ligase
VLLSEPARADPRATTAGARPARARTPPALAAVALLLAVALPAWALSGAAYDPAQWGALSVALAVVVVAVLWGHPRAPSPAAIACLAGLLGLTAWSALSMTWAESVTRAWTESNRWGLYLLVLAITVLCVRSTRLAQAVVVAMAGACALVVVSIAARMVAGDASLFWDFRLNGPLGYINGEAGYLLIGLWLFLALAEPGRRPAVRALAVGLAVLDADLLVLTQSRAVLPAVAVSVAFVLLIRPGVLARGWALLATVAGAAAAAPWLLAVYAVRGDGPALGAALVRDAGVAAVLSAIGIALAWAAGRWLAARYPAVARPAGIGILAVAAVILLGGVATVAQPARLRAQYDRFVTLRVDEGAGSRFLTGGGNRYDLWRAAVLEARRHPVAGVGAGNYATGYFRERRTTEPVRQPHSLELQTLSELGVVGGLALAVFLLALLGAGVRPARSAPARGDLSIRVAALGGVTAWLVQTSVDWLHLLPAVTGMALVLGGLLLCDVRPPRPAGTTLSGGSRRSVLLLAALTAGVAVLAASTGRQAAADVYRGRAGAALAADPVAAISAARQSVALDPAAPEGYYLLAAAWARLDDAARVDAALREAARREPSNYVTWALLGDVARREGRAAAARALYRRAAALNPLDAGLRELAALPAAAPAPGGAG